MPITHIFVSTKTDSTDDTLVKPSDWNAVHVGAPDEMASDDISYTLNEVTTATSLTEDYDIIIVNVGGTTTITLPAADSNTNRKYTIKNTHGTGRVIVDANSKETIDGEQTVDLNLQYQYITIICDGDEWLIIGGEYVKMEDLLGQILCEIKELNETAKGTQEEVKEINS